jgi:hypothetical protein
MLKKLLFLSCALILSTAPVMAMSHEGGCGGCGGDGPEHMGPPPGLMIPLPPDTEMPPPEEGPQALVEIAMAELDGDDDDQLSKDEVKAAHEMMEEHMGGCGEGGCGGCGGCGGEGPDGPPMGPPPFPHLLIPADFTPPPPEDGPGAMMEAAFDAIDGDGDGRLSMDEIKGAFEAAMEHHGEHMGGCGEGGCGEGGCGEGGSGEGGCGEGGCGEGGCGEGGCGGEMGMDPEWEEAECNGAVGNHVIRELGTEEGTNAVAISLPDGREAGCFTLDVDGADMDDLDFEMQIVEETDPPSDPAPVMWHSDDGKEAYEDLVLEEGIYHVEILSADGEGLIFTVSFVDYPAE